MSSFLTDLPFKNSFIAIKYNHIGQSPKSKLKQKNIKANGNETASLINLNCYMTPYNNTYSNNIPQTVSFLSRTDRFQQLSEDKRMNPGPGTYQPATFNNNSLSSKGYGIGFVSKEERFRDIKYERGKYSPGPGEYKYERYKTMQYSIMTSLQGKSLYNAKMTKSKKSKEHSPGPWDYNPIKTQDNADSLYGPSFHKLKCKRFQMKFNDIPGPGTYAKDMEAKGFKGNGKISFFFKKPKQIKEDYLKKYHIKTEANKDRSAFRLKQNTKDGQLLKSKIKQTAISSSIDNTTKSQIEHIRNSKVKEAIEDDEEYEEVEWNTRRKDLFGLAAPRWKEYTHQFLVPGPAFYCPKITQNRLSFNSNNETFVCSPGVLFSSNN